MSQTIEGGCFCGNIRYSFTDPIIASVNCHCTMCRRTSAAPYVSWLVVPTGQFAYTRGEPAVLKSSEHGIRYFCDSCGTPLVCINDTHPDWVDVTLGSLDEPQRYPPSRDVYADTRLDWIPSLPAPDEDG